MAEAESEKYSILIVDDEPPIRRVISDLLRKRGEYTVETAEHGKAALERLRESGCAFDLLITDMLMPVMNGEELIQHVVEEFPELPIAVLTANKNDRNVVRCLELGAMEYVMKPIRVQDFLQTVQRALERRHRMLGKKDSLEVQSEFEGWVELTAPTDFEYVERFQKFTSLLGNIPLPKEAREDIRIAIDEIGQNAVEWGNRGDRQKRIRLSYCLFDDRLVFKIEDEGGGFDPAALDDPSVDPLAHIMKRMNDGKRPGGYGVFITRKLMDDLLYNEHGNMVLLTKFFGRSQTSPEASS